MVSPDLTGLSVILTAACNLGCAYCYQNAKQPRRMSWQTLEATLDLAVRASRGRELRLLFTGGEPLLEFDLLRRAVDHVETIRQSGLRVRYELVTNGTLLNDARVAFLADHEFAVQVSFDGVPAAQDVRSPGTFAVLDAQLDRLRARHARYFHDRISVGLTVVPATLGYLAESVAYFLGKGVAEIAIAPALTGCPDWRDDFIAPLDRQMSRIYRSSLEWFRRTGEIPVLLFRKRAGRAPRRARPLPMCGVAERHHLVVDADGQVYGCVGFAESYQRFPTEMLRSRMERLRMGDVRAPDLGERVAAYRERARTTDILTGKERKYSGYMPCGECRFLRSCLICPLSIGHLPGNDDPHRMPDFACAFTRTALKYRSLFPRQPTIADLARGRVKPPAALRRILAAANTSPHR